MDQLRVMAMFRRVVELSSFSAAALDLEIDAATMSRQIAQLESEFGTKLLLRSTRSVSATAAGQTYYEGCVKTLEGFESTRRRILDMASTPRGRLRVSAPMSFGIKHISEVVPKFLEQYPDAQIELQLDDAVVDIVGESYDAAIRIRTELPDSGLMRKALARIRRCIVAAPSYLRKHGSPQTPDDLLKRNCLEYTLGTHSRAHWPVSGRNGRNEQVDIAGNFCTNNSLAMIPALIAGKGIGLIPRFAVNDALEKGELVEILTEYTPSPHTLCLVHGQKRLQSAVLRAFADVLESEMKKLEASGVI